jgi:hypothetical protein
VQRITHTVAVLLFSFAAHQTFAALLRNTPRVCDGPRLSAADFTQKNLLCGKKAGEAYARKSGPGTLKEIRQQ